MPLILTGTTFLTVCQMQFLENKFSNMKRILIALTALLAITSCSKEPSNDLVGTKWETTGFTLIDAMMGWKYHIYEFLDSEKVDSYWLDRNGKVASFDGTYKYIIAEPYVFIEHKADDIRELERTNKMTMVLTSNDSIKYLKQQ